MTNFESKRRENATAEMRVCAQ